MISFVWHSTRQWRGILENAALALVFLFACHNAVSKHDSYHFYFRLTLRETIIIILGVCFKHQGQFFDNNYASRNFKLLSSYQESCAKIIPGSARPTGNRTLFFLVQYKMHHNQTGIFTNSLSSHASLLLSASPTIITSPLQNYTNNPQNSSQPTSETLARKQPGIPLLLANNLDRDSLIQTESPSNINITEEYINFKKPQNEMFKKLDGKIQKIVAAHSNLNKLYALNDFSSLGAGPKRPFELPPQLPPPPPWVPKGATEYVSTLGEEIVSPSNATSSKISHVETMNNYRSNPRLFDSKSIMKTSAKRIPSGKFFAPKSSSLTLDSAISKLHQRRRQQQNQQQHSSQNFSQQQRPFKHHQLNLHLKKSLKTHHGLEISPNSPMASSSSTNRTTPTISPSQYTLSAQKIKDAFETSCTRNGQSGALSSEDKRKFQEDLIAILKREISAVTKSAKLRFSPNLEASPKPSEHKSFLSKSSPQSLFNTIRHETSLLLNRRQQHISRSSLSLLTVQQTFNRQNAHINLSTQNRQQINRPQTIKVVVPPTQYCSGLRLGNYLERESPQPTTDMITLDQFAKCLNLVRSNDASLQRHQEHLLQSETKWRMHVGNRPLRLRRLRGERIHMPASASYRATKKAGLQ